MYHSVTKTKVVVGGALDHQRTRWKLAFLANPMVVELMDGQNWNNLRLMKVDKVLE